MKTLGLWPVSDELLVAAEPLEEACFLSADCANLACRMPLAWRVEATNHYDYHSSVLLSCYRSCYSLQAIIYVWFAPSRNIRAYAAHKFGVHSPEIRLRSIRRKARFRSRKHEMFYGSQKRSPQVTPTVTETRRIRGFKNIVLPLKVSLSSVLKL